MATTVADALCVLQDIVDRGGPEVADYADLAVSIETLHQAEFVIENGLSRRAEPSSEIDQFFARNVRTFCTTASFQGFVRCKPHGYAGDYELIERIYNKSISGHADIARWDAFCLLNASTEAVRNRSAVFQGLVKEIRPEDLLSVACGPGLDVAAALTGGSSILSATLLDNDPNALRRAAVNLAGANLDLSFSQANALRYRPERAQGLIWCSGLFDYLSDRASVILLRRLYEALKPGGVLAVGNFAEGQTSRAYMETVGHWLLIHRTEDAIRILAAAAGIPLSRTEVRADETGVNLFLVAHA